MIQRFIIRRRSTLKNLKQRALQNIQKLDMHLDEQTKRDHEIRNDLKVRLFSPVLHMFLGSSNKKSMFSNRYACLQNEKTCFWTLKRISSEQNEKYVLKTCCIFAKSKTRFGNVLYCVWWKNTFGKSFACLWKYKQWKHVWSVYCVRNTILKCLL